MPPDVHALLADLTYARLARRSPPITRVHAFDMLAKKLLEARSVRRPLPQRWRAALPGAGLAHAGRGEFCAR